MAIKRNFKVVNSLPSTLIADAVYLVKTGAGFDLYATNSTGVIIASKLNTGESPKSDRIHDVESSDFYYYSYIQESNWFVLRTDRTDLNVTEVATVGNNPTKTTQADAWVDRTSLIYA